MKKVVFILLIIFSALFFSCSKRVDSSSSPTATIIPAESAILFTINVDPGSGNIFAVVGTSPAINVKVSSVILAAGVTINVTVTKDLDNSTVFTVSNSSLSTDNNITITGLTPGVLCTATVVVTSKSTTTNNKTTTFKLASKSS